MIYCAWQIYLPDEKETGKFIGHGLRVLIVNLPAYRGAVVFIRQDWALDLAAEAIKKCRALEKAKARTVSALAFVVKI